MRHSVKRMLSVVLALMLCLSLFSGLTFAATVDYQTGDPMEGYSNVILNWGTRGTTATFLSPNAEKFYETNQVTYDELIQKNGAAAVSGVPGSELYQSLQELMTSNHQVITTYGDTRYLYSYTDCQQSTRSMMTCFYSGISIGPDWDSGKTWNREHTWPNSKGMDGSDEDDIMMLRPASSSENSSRGNKAYGENGGSFDPNLPSNGKLNLHGDVARIALYIYVRWGNTEKLLGEEGMIESLDTLLNWMKEDPVDTWEMGRNDSVESITGTRNVFVDYPELAYVLFDQTIPTDMVTPSGEAINSGMDYTITAQSNNNAWGVVSRSGNTINAYPSSGYEVVGYTLISGDASVTQKGNAFTVGPKSDCTIMINFQPRVALDISFMENGKQTQTTSIYRGDVLTLPESTVTVGGDYSFLGWITEALPETTVKPAQVYPAGSGVIVSDAVTYYALYSRLDAQGSGSSTVYELFDGALVEGNYLITHDNGAMKASVSDKKRMDFLAITPVGATVDNPAQEIIWNISFTDDGYVTLYNASANSYAAGSGTKNQAVLISSVTDYGKWSCEALEGGVYEFINLGNENKGINKTLRRNADFGFACYATSTGSALTLYKQASGAVYYSTTAAACAHGNVSQVEAKEATCTEAGYTAGVYCNDCKSYISGYEQLDAKGHNYVGAVTPPTATEEGYTVYTCSACGDSYTGDYTEALGQQYQVTFVVPQGVAAIEAVMCGKSGITLPTAGTLEGYAFAGWVTESVQDTTDAPTIYTGSFTTQENVTLYALYTYVTGGSQEITWKQVTDASQLSVGDKVVLGESATGKVASEIYSQYLTDVDAQFSEDGTILTQLPEGAVVLTLGEAEGVWTLTNEAGQLLCGTGVKKLAWDRGTSTWSITIDELGGATVSSTNETYGRLLYNVKSPRFTTYTSSTSASMLMPQLYKLEGSMGQTYYTTLSQLAPQGVTLSGAITSGKNTTGVITVELWAEELVSAVTTEGGVYTIGNVAAGTYTLKISKANHVTRSYTITVGAEDLTQDVKICLLGDVTNDGVVNIGDVARLYAHSKQATVLTDEYVLACANANGGSLNIGDVAVIYAHVKGGKQLF